jgi:uncharacterized Zn finger protein (UPF0148 family)
MPCNSCNPNPPRVSETTKLLQPKEGNQLTDQACPNCSAPLGKTVKGELIILWCSNAECAYRFSNS